MAKNKIEEFKTKILEKDKEIVELKVSFEKSIESMFLEIKDHDSESGQIIKQYEERLLRYQKSLEDSDNLVSKYQAQALTNSKSN